MIFLGCGGWAPLLIKTRISVLKRSVNNKTARTPEKREALFVRRDQKPYFTWAD
jgi:hypothetical protein